ncbi:MAG: SHOCT domain-containing protein [Sphingobacteriales bacterium]|nr:SHOCT domain-containing protein [Sphingobacteriales bacterium]
MKAMSIIGIILFSIFILIYFASESPHESSIYSEAFFAGFFGVLFGLAYSITGLVYSNNKLAIRGQDITIELVKLSNLKDKGIITEVQFEEKRDQMLSMLSSDLRNI